MTRVRSGLLHLNVVQPPGAQAKALLHGLILEGGQHVGVVHGPLGAQAAQGHGLAVDVGGDDHAVGLGVGHADVDVVAVHRTQAQLHGAARCHTGGGQNGGEQGALERVGLAVVFERGLDGDGRHARQGGGVQRKGLVKLDAVFAHHLVDGGVQRAAVGLGDGAADGEQRGAAGGLGRRGGVAAARGGPQACQAHAGGDEVALVHAHGRGLLDGNQGRMVSARCRGAMQKIAVVQPSLAVRQSPPGPAIAREAHGAAPTWGKRSARCVVSGKHASRCAPVIQVKLSCTRTCYGPNGPTLQSKRRGRTMGATAMWPEALVCTLCCAKRHSPKSRD